MREDVHHLSFTLKGVTSKMERGEGEGVRVRSSFFSLVVVSGSDVCDGPNEGFLYGITQTRSEP